MTTKTVRQTVLSGLLRMAVWNMDSTLVMAMTLLHLKAH